MHGSTNSSPDNLLDNVDPAADVICRQFHGDSPEMGIVLGSGFGDLISDLDNRITIPYRQLPGIPETRIAGHSGEVHLGFLGGRKVLVFAGRFHVYEGYSAWQVSVFSRLFSCLGVKKVLLTNAAGGIADTMAAGDFMLVTDHINMTGHNPLIGHPDFGFPDLQSLYRTDFGDRFGKFLQTSGIQLHRGILAWMTGPSYETPAEIRMLQQCGASAVSMSTIPEAIMAQSMGLSVCALSFISNLASGKSSQSLHHEDVLAVSRRSASHSCSLVHALVEYWPGPF